MLSPAFSPTRAFSLTRVLSFSVTMEEFSDRIFTSVAGLSIPVITTQEKVFICFALLAVYLIFRSILSIFTFILFLPFRLLKLLIKSTLWVITLPLKILCAVFRIPYYACNIIQAIGALGVSGTIWYITTGTVGSDYCLSHFNPLKHEES